MKMKIFRYIAILIILSSCTTTRIVTEYKEKIVHDSITTIDTIHNHIFIKGDTVFKKSEIVNIDTIIKYRVVNIDTLKAQGKYARCEGGVVNSKPFLTLYEQDIDIITDNYIKTIKIKDTIIRDKKSEIEKLKNKPFWDNPFFWSTVILSLLIFLIIKFK